MTAEFFSERRYQSQVTKPPALHFRELATEIAQALVRYGFEELEFSEVWASTDAPNVASVSVLEKAGLRFERRAVVDGLETLFYCLPRSAFQPGGYR